MSADRIGVPESWSRAAMGAAALTATIAWLLSCGGMAASGNVGDGPAAAATVNPCGGVGQDPECHTLVWEGVTRAYLLHVPTGFQPGRSALVVGLHGSHGSGSMFAQTSQLNIKADQAGFAVAYPSALVSPGAGFTEWNEFFNHSFGNSPPDDVGFIRQVITTLQGALQPDPKRIFVTGLSNGGFMAHRVGVQLSDLVAAIAVVEGTLVSPGRVEDAPPPLGPVSVLVFHGDQDPTVLYCGGPAVASQEQTFNFWAGPAADDCRTLDTAAPLCDAQGSITAVLEKRATDCRASTAVQFYRLQGGVHSWYLSPMNVPGLVPFNPGLTAGTGVTTDDILWNFFASHAKP